MRKKDNLARPGPVVRRAKKESGQNRRSLLTAGKLESHVPELRFLSEFTLAMLSFQNLQEMYDHIAAKIKELSGADYLILTALDESQEAVRIVKLEGIGKLMGQVRRLLGFDPFSLRIRIKDMTADEMKENLSHRLVPVRDGLYGLGTRRVPGTVTGGIEKLLGIRSMHTMGFTWNNRLYGGITLLYKKLKEPPHRHIIETLVNQAAMAVQRLLAEEALRRERDKTQKYLDVARVMIVIIAPDGRVTLINQLGCRILGYDEKDIIGKNWFDRFLPERIRDVTRKVFNRIMQGEIEEVEYHENPVLTRSGEERSVAWHSILLEDEGGKINGVVSSGEDITERKRAEEMLRESEKKYRDLAEMLPQTIFEMNLDGRLTFVNRSAYEVFGYTAADFKQGLTVVQMLVPEEHARARLNLQKILLGETTAGNEYIAMRKEGSTFPVILYTAPIIREGKATGMRGILADISERKADEDRIRASLHEKEVLLKEIHHRVKNNLQIISGLLALQEAVLKDPESRKLFANTQNRIRSMALIHERLYKSDNLSRINFKGYVENLTTMLLDTFFITPGQVAVEVKMNECYFDINTAIPLGLIVNELVSNALKYAFPDGRGEIRVQLFSDAGEKWMPGMNVHGRVQHELVITDNGIGLPGDINISESSGFGLQMVQMMVKQLGGSFFWKCENGTEFRIRFASEIQYE